MRILFFGNPLFGHIIPQLPLARALRDQGHATAFLSAASIAGLLASEGLEHVVAGPETFPDVVAEVERGVGFSLVEKGITPETEAELFAGARLDLGFEAADAAARDWKPDLIVAEAYDFLGPMVGAALGVPVATVSLGPAIPSENAAAMRVRAEDRHRRHGLDAPTSHWFLETCPPSLQFDDFQAPATLLPMRPEAYTGATVRADPARPGSAVATDRSRPRLLLSFGTIFVFPEVMTPIARELLKQDVDIRLALGPAKTRADFDLDSDRVEFVGFTPLERLLHDVDAVITVGGAGTVLGSLAHGLPLVMTPLNADQPLHAGRAAAAGAGIAFGIGQAEPRAVAEAVATVLTDPSYRNAAQRVAAEIAAMPSPTQVAEKLIADQR
ncbi:glycosyltransferase [Actinospica sp.]|uniref:glycosyltransferase n=1 Tax=Actinospica sp. TaxID=1872142 RepID=UPI002B842834|nr:glycosyltransferase [Actinospica sp.]HWG26674.1 glycosyltransferase [Actinospica sp.]